VINLRKLCVGLWLTAATLFGCQRCNAQVHLVKTEIRVCTPVSCRVEVGTASSVCVGRLNDAWYFVTAGHAFYSSRPEAVSSKALNAHVAIDQQWVPATIVGFDKPSSRSDLGLLSVRLPRALRSLPLAEHLPPVGSEVSICGFPSGSPYAEVKGSLLPLPAADARSDFLVSTAVVRGVSGGPVVHKGEVVGIVSASDFGSGTWAVGPDKIRQRLVQQLGRLPDCGRPQETPARPEGPGPSMAATPAAPSPPAAVPSFPASQAPPTIPSAPATPSSPAAPANPAGESAPLEEKTRSESSPRAGGLRVEAGVPVDPGSIAGSAWTTLWSVLAPTLGVGGPIGAGIGLAGWLVARRLGPKVVDRVQERWRDRIVERPVDAPVPVPTPVPVTKNRFVDVPVVNGEAEALKEAMRLEAEFTRTDNPQVAMHLRRVQEMADLILQGKRIDKPGWKTD